MKRIHSIDIMRGFVMILMTLDHTRDLLHITSITQQPTDLTTTSVWLFLTRWVTHLCAPTFVFLSGSSAFLSFKHKGISGESRRHLIIRGLLLILLDFTVVNFGVWFDIHFNVFLFDVLSAIGVGFIVLGLLLPLKPRSIGIMGLVIIALHNLSPLAPLPETSLCKTILMPLFGPTAFPLGSGVTFVMGYPPIPWLGILLVGFASGQLFELPEQRRKNRFLKLGMLCALLFVCIRMVNFYGDSVPWQVQKTNLFTVLSFINVTKYPPSLQFCLLMLGSMFVLLYFIEGVQNRFTRIASVYGKVPLFYFLVHWYVIHPIVFLMVYLQGFSSSDLVFGFNFGRPPGSGLRLWLIYVIWVGILLLLYPVCKQYGRYKERNKHQKWLSYL